jgi:hypothetical protein
MGEDFFRGRNDRFIRQRDARFIEQLIPDLFSACVPSTVMNVCGTALREVDNDDELWTPEVNVSGPICFYRGGEPAVRLDGPAADHVRSEHGDRHVPIVAQVVQVERDHGLVTLRVGSPA